VRGRERSGHWRREVRREGEGRGGEGRGGEGRGGEVVGEGCAHRVADGRPWSFSFEINTTTFETELIQ
jgi:hypothetical protein